MTDKDFLYWQLRQENDQFLKRQTWWWRHWLAGTLRSIRQRQALELAREAEQLVAARIEQMGYSAHLTTHKCPFDLWVADDRGRAARVEVKISLFNPYKNRDTGGRYQANIRRHLDADLVIFIARNGRDWPFIIPMSDIRPRRNIAIWSKYPASYSGQWAQYLDAWHHLEQAITNSQARSWQLTLIHSQGG